MRIPSKNADTNAEPGAAIAGVRAAVKRYFKLMHDCDATSKAFRLESSGVTA
jgi:hypothetical protein